MQHTVVQQTNQPGVLLLKVKRKAPGVPHPQHIALQTLSIPANFYPEDAQLGQTTSKRRFDDTRHPNDDVATGAYTNQSLTSGATPGESTLRPNDLVSLFGNLTCDESPSSNRNNNPVQSAGNHIASASGYVQPPPASDINNAKLREQWGSNNDNNNNTNNNDSTHPDNIEAALAAFTNQTGSTIRQSGELVFQHVGVTTERILNSQAQLSSWISANNTTNTESPNTVSSTRGITQPIAVFEVEMMSDVEQLLQNEKEQQQKLQQQQQQQQQTKQSTLTLLHGKTKINANEYKELLNQDYQPTNNTKTIPGLKPPPPRRNNKKDSALQAADNNSNTNPQVQYHSQRFNELSATGSLLDSDTLSYINQRKAREQQQHQQQMLTINKDTQQSNDGSINHAITNEQQQTEEEEDVLYDVYQICVDMPNTHNQMDENNNNNTTSPSSSSLPLQSFARVVPKQQLDYLIATYHAEKLLQHFGSVHDEFVSQFDSNRKAAMLFGGSATKSTKDPLLDATLGFNEDGDEENIINRQNLIIDGYEDDDYNRYHNDSDIDYPDTDDDDGNNSEIDNDAPCRRVPGAGHDYNCDEYDNDDDDDDGDEEIRFKRQYARDFASCSDGYDDDEDDNNKDFLNSSNDDDDGDSDDDDHGYSAFRYQRVNNNAHQSSGRVGVDYGEELDQVDPQLREYIILQQAKYRDHINKQSKHLQQQQQQSYKLAGSNIQKMDDEYAADIPLEEQKKKGSSSSSFLLPLTPHTTTNTNDNNIQTTMGDDTNNNNNNNTNNTMNDTIEAEKEEEEAENKIDLSNDIFSQFFELQQQKKRNGYGDDDDDDNEDPYGGTNSLFQYHRGRAVRQYGEEDY